MRMLIFATSALLTVTAGTAAKAHAFLDHAEPRVGSTVPIAPRELVLSYTQNLEPAFSSVEVSDANGARVDLGLPDFFNHLIPIFEVSLTTPVANNFGNPYTTTGTVNPGVIWVGSYFQVGLEAMIPINRESGTGVGVIGQLHLYLDDMFPTTVGQPLFGGTAAAPRKLTF